MRRAEAPTARAGAASRDRKARGRPGASRWSARARSAGAAREAARSPRARWRTRPRPASSTELAHEPHGHAHLTLAGAPERDDATVLDRRDLTDGAFAGAVAGHVRDELDRERDMARDRRFAELAAPRQKKGEPIQRAGRGARVQGRERALVTRAQRLEQGRRLARRAHLTDEDPIRPHP